MCWLMFTLLFSPIESSGTPTHTHLRAAMQLSPYLTMALHRCALARSDTFEDERAAMVPPSKLSFPESPVPFPSFLKLLNATGNRTKTIIVEDLNLPPLPLLQKELTYWQAIDAAATFWKMPFKVEEGTLKFLEPLETYTAPPIQYVGPFRLAIANIQRRSTDACEIGIELLWEPRHQPLALVITPNSYRYLLNEKEATINQGSATIRLAGLDGYKGKLSLPATSGKNLKQLSFQAEVLIAPKPTKFQFDAFKPSSLKQADSELKLLSLVQQGTMTNLKLQLHLPETTPRWESHQHWAFDAVRFHLVHKQTGQTITAPFTPAMILKDHEITFSPSFGKLQSPLADYRLEAELPIPIRTIPIKVEWKDIPLP